MLQQTLSKHALHAFTDTLLSHFSPQNEYHRHLFSDGLKLYRNGHVYNVEATDTTLTGTVQATEGKVNVTIGLIDYNETTCSCTNSSYCEHLFAVLFYAYANVCGIGELLTKWKENTNRETKKTTLLVKKKKPVTVDHSPENWEKLFQQQYDSFLKEVIRPTPFDYYYRFLPRLVECGPEDETMLLIYRLKMSYIVLACMYNSQQDNTTLYNFSNQQILNRFIHELRELVHQLRYTDYKKQAPAIVQLLTTLETVIEEQAKLPTDLYDQYRILWTYVASPNFIYEAITELERERNRGIKSDWYDYKLAHLYVLQGKDKEAMNVITNHVHSPSILFFWIDFQLEKGNNAAAKSWLSFAHQHICQLLAKNETFSTTRLLLGQYLSYYTADDSIVSDEEIELAFQDTWPASISYYEEYLVDKQKFKQWIELTAYVGIDVLYERKQLIKLLEKEDGASLLPLYHQLVMKQIQQKNRMSYKQAVRYLKKLRTIYRRQKELPMWDTYIKKLQASTTRLRAFQEELRRAKLIEDEN
ncbi:MAG: SWIM zinc finger domain-containing protein [Bacillaceae bacterium]